MGLNDFHEDCLQELNVAKAENERLAKRNRTLEEVAAKMAANAQELSHIAREYEALVRTHWMPLVQRLQGDNQRLVLEYSEVCGALSACVAELNEARQQLALSRIDVAVEVPG